MDCSIVFCCRASMSCGLSASAKRRCEAAAVTLSLVRRLMMQLMRVLYGLFRVTLEMVVIDGSLKAAAVFLMSVMVFSMVAVVVIYRFLLFRCSRRGGP